MKDEQAQLIYSTKVRNFSQDPLLSLSLSYSHTGITLVPSRSSKEGMLIHLTCDAKDFHDYVKEGSGSNK